MNDFIKQNGGPLAIAATALLIGAAYLEWRIDEITEIKLSEAGIVSLDRIDAIEDDERGGFFDRLKGKSEEDEAAGQEEEMQSESGDESTEQDMSGDSDLADAIEGEVEDTQEQHKLDSDRMDRKIERVVDVLLED